MRKRDVAKLTTLMLAASATVSYFMIRFLTYTQQLKGWNYRWRPSELQESFAKDLSKDIGFNYLEAMRPPRPTYFTATMIWQDYVIVAIVSIFIAAVGAMYVLVMYYRDQNQDLRLHSYHQSRWIQETKLWTPVEDSGPTLLTYPALGVEVVKRRE